MSNLSINLPPFTPDYSGASSALYELGGMLVLHDASGCTGNVLGYDEPRWEDAANSRALVFCSAYRHLEAILGQDDKVIDRIVAAAESLKPRFIAVIGSPVPMLVGTDYNGIAKEIEAKTGIPSFGFDTKGLEFYDNGYTKATIAIIKRYASKKDKRKNHINLLGLTPIDFGNKGNDKAIIDLVKSNGFDISCSFSMDFTIEDVENAREAELNVALSEGGVEVAAFMEKAYGIPYTSGVPFGDGKLFINKIRRALGQKEDEIPKGSRKDKRVLIIGEQVQSNSMRDSLLQLGVDNIHVAIPFTHRNELLEKNDIPFVQERDIRKMVNSGLYTDIVADPLIGDLIKDKNVHFHANPSVAISSKFHWDEVLSILGDGMNGFLESIAE